MLSADHTFRSSKFRPVFPLQASDAGCPPSSRETAAGQPALGLIPEIGGDLGTTAKFQATSSHKGFQPFATSAPDPETGEIIQPRDAAECRLERYALQAVVREILPDSRTAKCLRFRQSKANGVDVFRSVKFKRAHYGGLQTCSSVWACPICTAKISERRRVELQELIASHEATGGVVLLVTRTVPHARQDDLGGLVAQIAKAEAGYKAHRDYKAFAKAFGIVGTVRAFETTWGEANGFHPHTHELLFLSIPVMVADLEEDLFRIWQGAAVRAGLPAPSRAHGLSVQDGTHAAKYAAKWGLESELTQWHKKRGKVGSLSPFDFLRWYMSDKSPRAAALFRTYTEAFRGRHQLQFSRGLKNLYQVVDFTDEELTQCQDDDAERLGQLTVDQWRLVCKSEQRGALLEVASSSGWEGVCLLVDSLARHYARTPGGGT